MSTNTSQIEGPDCICGRLALLVEVPSSERVNSIDDIAEAYAVDVGDDIPGGCIIWGRYRGKWHANVSARWLVSKFILGATQMLQSGKTGVDDLWTGWEIIRRLVEVQEEGSNLT